jgi:hypothetical protein
MKAFAKLPFLDGRPEGYESLSGGWAKLGVVMLTGSPIFEHFWKSKGAWLGDVVTQTANDGFKHRQPQFIRRTTKQLWEALLRGTRDSRLMVASIRKRNAIVQGESKLANGLYDGHAYSVLQARLFDPAQPAESCFAEVEVTYTKPEEWVSDKRRIKRFAWDLTGPERFMGGSWETSRAARFGVGAGWTLVDRSALTRKATKVTTLRVSFRGVVEVGCCSPWSSSPYKNTRIEEMPVNSLSEPVRLVQVRNPWGNSELFTGAWSDSDLESWKQHYDVAHAAGFSPQEDGMWWMTLEDFVVNFDLCSVGEVNMHKFSPGSGSGSTPDLPRIKVRHFF